MCLYVDNLIFTRNNLKMIAEFKGAMMKHFEVTDLGLMPYFLGIEVVQQDDEIVISQKKYANDILKKFQMENSKLVSTPLEESLKIDKRR